jgi:beta-glucosidase
VLQHRVSGHLDTATELVYAKGCDVNSADISGFDAAVQAAVSADVVRNTTSHHSRDTPSMPQVLLFLGLDHGVEDESLDRDTIGLPGVQNELVGKLTAALDAKAKANGDAAKVTVVLVNGGALAIKAVKESPR